MDRTSEGINPDRRMGSLWWCRFTRVGSASGLGEFVRRFQQTAVHCHGDGFRAVLGVHFLQDLFEVVFHRVLGHHQPVADFLVGETCCQVAQDLNLAFG